MKVWVFANISMLAEKESFLKKSEAIQRRSDHAERTWAQKAISRMDVSKSEKTYGLVGALVNEERMTK